MDNIDDYRFVFGPVPSRRMGLSLGVSPIPKKACNYSCIYCQLGRTDRLTNKREMFFDPADILAEFDAIIRRDLAFDVISIVGEGEPTLYLGLGTLIAGIKERTAKPLAVITNGALLYDRAVRSELTRADMILPSLDAFDEASFRRINRPHGRLRFDEVFEGLVRFSHGYKGEIWLETMLMEGINDSDEALERLLALIGQVRHSRLYINTPVRPPAEAFAKALDRERMARAAGILGGISIDLLQSEGFHSEAKDDLTAVKSIIGRHPMKRPEIESFLRSRGCDDTDMILKMLENDEQVVFKTYNGSRTYTKK